MSAAAPFHSLEEFQSRLSLAPTVDDAASAAAEARNNQLTKPPQSLGRLEDLAIWYAGWRRTPCPVIEKPQIVIFAGNHGIAAQGVSAFPPEVTAQMVANFNAGGAAINQLARTFGAKLDVIALSLDSPTKDISQEPAMTEAELVEALAIGWNAVDETSDLLVAGEMGIGNTTAASAIYFALFGGSVRDWVGLGTGIAKPALQNKVRLVEHSVKLHAVQDPLEVLRCLGGREIAAMTGAIARARIERIPVILDGFICSSAAAVLDRIDADLLGHAVAGHVSAEGAHQMALDHLGKQPLLTLDMRLGEGSGAALAIGVLKGAVACHSGMATFAEAGVSGG